MKDLNEINDRMDSNEEIIDSLIKKTTELEKRVLNRPEVIIPDYSVLSETIIKASNDIQAAADKQVQNLNLLIAINAKIDNQQKPTYKQIRFLLFPETNQGQYYKIVFGRLIPWGLAFMVATYIFITGYKAVEIYRYNDDVSQSTHYERAWLYLQQHAKKKMLSAMDDAYGKTAEK